MKSGNGFTDFMHFTMLAFHFVSYILYLHFLRYIVLYVIIYSLIYSRYRCVHDTMYYNSSLHIQHRSLSFCLFFALAHMTIYLHFFHHLFCMTLVTPIH